MKWLRSKKRKTLWKLMPRGPHKMYWFRYYLFICARSHPGTPGEKKEWAENNVGKLLIYMCQAQSRTGFHLHLILRIPPHTAAHATYALRVIGPVSEDRLQGSFASIVGLFCFYIMAAAPMPLDPPVLPGWRFIKSNRWAIGSCRPSAPVFRAICRALLPL